MILVNIFICNLLILFITIEVKAFPILPEADVNSSASIEEELRYPNGTVVGKYAYTDNEGNPVHVKYYADDSSYGVELNSVKVLSTDKDDTSRLKTNLRKTSENLRKTAEPIFDATTSVLDSYNKYPTNKYRFDAYDWNKNKNKEHKSDSDYEIYIQTDLSAPKKCSKDKVRVYNFDKQKRRARSAHKTQEEQSICGLF